jgi:hypothetical protein
MASKKNRISAEDFVKSWQSAPTLADFCSVTGMDARAASGRATSYRTRGIPLQKFQNLAGPPKLDIKALAKLAKG